MLLLLTTTLSFARDYGDKKNVAAAKAKLDAAVVDMNAACSSSRSGSLKEYWSHHLHMPTSGARARPSRAANCH